VWKNNLIAHNILEPMETHPDERSASDIATFKAIAESTFKVTNAQVQQAVRLGN